MSEEKCHPKVKEKVSLTYSSGYQCSNCGAINVIYDHNLSTHVPPTECIRCFDKLVSPVLVFRDKIKNHTTVETLKL